MPVKKAPSPATPDDINAIINKGSKSVGEPLVDSSKGIAFSMNIPSEICEIIDRLRKPTRTSRRTWLLNAAEEKLKRDGEM